MPFAEFDDVRLFYTDEGDGSPSLVLIHGLGADSHDWNWVIPHLRQKYRVVAYDLRGHGHSSTANDYSLDRQADDVVRLMRHRDCEQFVVVGHSAGGTIATKAAVANPSAVSAAITVDPAYGAPPWLAEAYDALYERWSSGAARNHDELMAMYAEVGHSIVTPDFLSSWNLRRLQATPIDVFWTTYGSLAHVDGLFGRGAATTALLRRRACPALSFHSLAEQGKWEANHSQHPLSHAVEWEGSGHYLHIERPRELVTVATRWLDQVSDTTS
ncbi:hypothetical protein ALI144C_07050 [Actinosynnema sp. ALI-1.44]|uniref:alpha/beta fold hydrolase n=1 Tax=Actinosynnema sp. ALI-1.44 TaxID=1933779 RepID=UPI00097C39DF|nr:alpha/beta hydrolase [Actinosynnema sp. ALI-1.44]ONI88307.1 hypothetical protein ALI144C_07050 [Actinosynnema sp. ALI-1.44]